MNNLFDNQIISISIILFLFLYGYNLGKMKLPSYIRKLFDNTIFKIVFLSLLLIFNFKNTPHIALVIAIIFVLTLDALNNQEAKENIMYYEAFVNQLH
ncbi:hypothetical protein Klosneuvirus_1_74 [Klosneuvirus KNV1]|uniref:Uncharacterized protein n=1 Tax=Klosneuvirus KNV1 TaxID=1977640 RepID=A0A1V0SHM6_9VIRU|nr:hypothetical protein Klosneuvirus_1_74 [Klosneuvirus KNV1]